MIVSSTFELPPVRSQTKRIIVIGSGAVGLYLAKTLADKGLEVVVIEAGEDSLGGFDSPEFACVGRNHAGIRIGRSRSLGGTSNLWGGQLVEFKRHDFEGSTCPPRAAWPVTYDELIPHYATTFQRLGISEEFHQDTPIWNSVAGKSKTLGDDLEVFLTRWMNVPSLAQLYRKSVECSSNLIVMLDHRVNGFYYDGSRVTGIRMRSPSGEDVRLDADTIVVAAGTIESCRLLLAAGGDEGGECPWRHNTMLGLRFQDHLGGRVGVIEPINRHALDLLFCTIRWKGLKFQPKIRPSTARLGELRMLSTMAMVSFESSISENLIFLKQFLKAAIYSRRIHGVHDFIRHAAASAKHLPPLMWAYLHDHRVFSPRDASIALVIQAEQLPLDESRITVDGSKIDRNGLPRVLLDWKVDGQEIVSIRQFLIDVRDALTNAGIGNLKIDQRILDRDPAVLADFRDTNHPSGGCVMGRSPSDGVVDSNLKVFGSDNLYVVGACVFPTSSDANVTFTAMALANRLADHLTIGSH